MSGMLNAFRDQVSKVPLLAETIDAIVAVFNALFGAEHSLIDGTHTDITADTITVSGDIVGESDGLFDGDVYAHVGDDAIVDQFELSLRGQWINGSVDGPALVLGSDASSLQWAIVGDQLGTTIRRLRFIPTSENSASRFIAQLSQDPSSPATGVYFLTANGAGGPSSTLTLGAPSSSGFSTGHRILAVYATDCDVLNGYTERSRTAKMGEWTTFTPTRGASAGTWTAGTLSTSAYMLIGKTMTVAFYWFGTSVSNANVFLTITIPNSMTAAKDMSNPIVVRDNGGAYATGNWDVRAGGTVINIYNGPGYAATFQISVTATEVYGVATFEVQ